MNVMGAFNVVLREARTDDVRREKENLAEKYAAIPYVSEWSYFHIKKSVKPQQRSINSFNPVLKLKRSAEYG